MRPPKPSIQAHLEILVSSGIILLHHFVVSCILMHLECRHQQIKQYFGLAKNCNFRQFWMQAQRISNSQYSIASRPCIAPCVVLHTSLFSQQLKQCRESQGASFMWRTDQGILLCHYVSLVSFRTISLSESFGSFHSSCMVHLPLQREKSSEVPPFVMLLDTWLTCLHQCQEAFRGD